MKLGAVVGMRDNRESFTGQARRLEDAGVEYLWVGEAYTADAVSALGFLAAVTRWAQLGSSILPLYTRTPSVLAMTAVGLDRLSGGRFILGIGASGPQVIEGFHGVPYDAPLARTAEIIEICRSVWRRDRLEHYGSRYQIPLPAEQGTGLGKPLKLIDHPIRERIPVYIASLGPKNVELTAAIADGWLPLHYWPERAARVWGEPLAAGRARREEGLAPLEVVAGGCWPSATTSSTSESGPGRCWRCTLAAWARAGGISTTTSSGAMGSSGRPIRSRTPTWPAGRRKQPPWYLTSSSWARPWWALRALSATRSPPTANRA